MGSEMCIRDRVESPTRNPLHEAVPINPVIEWYDGIRETLAAEGDDFPYACTVYRVVEREHFVTSNVPLLVETMPDFFVELPRGWPARSRSRTAARCASGPSAARCRAPP